MLTAILFSVILGVIVISFYTAEKDCLRAFIYDLQNRYKEAIYYYAVGTVSSSFFKDSCRRQIASLWKEHGPFDYSDVYNSAAKVGDRESFISREAVIEIIKGSSAS